MSQTDVVGSLKVHIMCSVFFVSGAFYEITWNIIVEWSMPQYGACALHTRYLSLHTQTQNIYYLLLFHRNDGYTKAPKCYVTRNFPVLFGPVFAHFLF